MPNKYQHALMDMKRSRAWQSIADELTVGLGETVNRSDVWGTAKGKWSSQKVMTAMENLGLVKIPGPRYRLAVDFPDDETRTAFREFYGIDNDELTFTKWVLSAWKRDTMRNKCTIGGTNMGTDIHLYLETGREGKWTPVEKPFIRDPEKDWSYSTWSDYWKKYDDKDYEVQIPDPTSRHYSVFALLADVRNGRGFAGVKTHEPVTPCFPRRGVPKDTTYSEGVWDEEEEDYVGGSDGWLGDHSYTWATVAELRDVPWDTEYETYGTIHVSQYEHFKKHGQPEHWSGGISGPGVMTWPTEAIYLEALELGEIPEDEFDDDKAGPFSSGKHHLVVLWSWRPLEDCAFKQWLYCDWMEELIEEANGPENIRVTMGFDS